jgi:hypothetical protein
MNEGGGFAKKLSSKRLNLMKEVGVISMMQKQQSCGIIYLLHGDILRAYTKNNVERA